MVRSFARSILSRHNSTAFKYVAMNLFPTAPIGSKPFTTSLYPLPGFQWIEGTESLDLYRPGGLHPTLPGDVLHSRYEVIDKLGHGGYSTVWLAHDRKRKGYVAIKVCVADPSIPRRDAKIMSSLSSEMVPGTLDDFEISGPNGLHPCCVMFLTQGSLADVKYNSVFPVETCRVLAAKMALAVAHVHSRAIIHGGWLVLDLSLESLY